MKKYFQKFEYDRFFATLFRNIKKTFHLNYWYKSSSQFCSNYLKMLLLETPNLDVMCSLCCFLNRQTNFFMIDHRSILNYNFSSTTKVRRVDWLPNSGEFQNGLNHADIESCRGLTKLKMIALISANCKPNI